MRFVVCLAGGIASGKSTLASALASDWQNPVIRSFGSVVRAEAMKDCRPTDRYSLQQIGKKLISRGWPPFVDALLLDLPEASSEIIIDGVRHLPAYREIRSRFPDCPVYLVFLQTGSKVIRERLAQREESISGLSHEIEMELQEVSLAADISLNSARPVTELIESVITLTG